MDKVTLGKTGLKISPVVFGGIINMHEKQEDADRYVAYAAERGVNYFDVAPQYGDAQERLGPALAPYRSQVYLACKTLERTADGAKADLLESLRLLRTDYFDVYQLHSVNTREDWETIFGPGGVMETVEWAKKEGLIRNAGFSSHNEDISLECLAAYDFDSIMFPFNWVMGINIGWGSRISIAAKAKGCGLLAIKVLIQRHWREGEKRPYPKSWCKPIYGNDALGVAAMKYAYQAGADALIPPGNFEHFMFMLDNADISAREPLTEAEWVMLRAEAEAVRGEMIFNA